MNVHDNINNNKYNNSLFMCLMHSVKKFHWLYANAKHNNRNVNIIIANSVYVTLHSDGP